MKMASTMATFIHVQKASVGVVKTRSVLRLTSGREMNCMTRSVMKTATTSPPAAETRLHKMRERSSPK